MTIPTLSHLALLCVFATLTCASTPPPTPSHTLRSLSKGTGEHDLCEIERGKYCTPRDPTNVQPPITTLPDEGWVCCAPAGTPCVAVPTYGECSMVGGYCYDYSVNEDDTVTCHD